MLFYKLGAILMSFAKKVKLLTLIRNTARLISHIKMCQIVYFMQRKSASMKCNIDKELRAYRFLFIRIIVGSKIDSRGPQSFYFLFHMIDYIPT